jgi:coproporphyrinogen III oxidase-like Fe-S oxidoreductase
MCNGYLNMPETASKFAISTDELKRTINYFPEKFQTFIDDNLLSINNDILELKSMGFLVVRNIAMAFDPMLKSENNLYSKTV